MKRVAIIRTGAANIASVAAAFHRLGADCVVANEPADVKVNDYIVLPGVGSFRTGIQAIRQNHWDDFLLSRFESNKPTLAICLGFQLLCESSEEASDEEGLGILPGQVKRFSSGVTVPQFGWNRVEAIGPRFEDGYVYFANSYCLPSSQWHGKDWEILKANYGINFVAGVLKGNWLACQFHPELSGKWGQRLLDRWLRDDWTAETSGSNADEVSRSC
ncbi:MAG: imidazole glycerol phosphate synthase subunit HisH [Planctomycetota bacterium]